MRLVGAITLALLVCWFTVLGLALYLLYARRRADALDFIGFLGVNMTGILCAFMLAQVANRYFTIAFPVFTAFAALGLKRMVDTIQRRPSARPPKSGGSGAGA